MTTKAYIGLGSNLKHPLQQVFSAIERLKNLTTVHVLACSKFYRTPPLGPQDQPDYINAVVELNTTLSPHELLKTLQKIEQQQGRTRETGRWGARVIDLDLLVFGNKTINTTDLIVPHPGISLRSFVVYPLVDLSPNLDIPGLGIARTLLEAFKDNPAEIVDIEKLHV